MMPFAGMVIDMPAGGNYFTDTVMGRKVVA